MNTSITKAIEVLISGARYDAGNFGVLVLLEDSFDEVCKKFYFAFDNNNTKDVRKNAVIEYVISRGRADLVPFCNSMNW